MIWGVFPLFLETPIWFQQISIQRSQHPANDMIKSMVSEGELAPIHGEMNGNHGWTTHLKNMSQNKNLV